ncbi:unannotated protein [freshwater metagenome]|jgi:hypothetical protein|uniref:Unannotated protein n=1 Tax=freshwater metagenome TaxID=449393 RepID=A0A6J7I356_9ZZZZ|nr:hypothetical protein [Actinomycetota bacterium]MSZ24247.1 hypothetical protein [Actinomycetota bacterium]MSZ92687.1 hypothetical protein [Actinomycetota bacterium]
MGKFANSKALAGASFGVLKSEKKLAAIPAVSALTCGVIAVAVGGGVLLTADFIANPAPGQDDFSLTPASWAIGIVGLFIIGLVSQVFAATLIAAANERLDGGSFTMGQAFSKATSRTPSIVGWSAINSTVGVVLQAVRDKAGFVGDIAAGFIGAAWNVITWLVLPIIVVEGIGPIAAIKKSASLLKTTWGENLFAQAGIGLIGFLLMLPGIIVFGALSFAVPVVGIPLLLLWIVVIGCLMSALGAIYRTALYRFAVGLSVGDVFTKEELAGAFKPKAKTGRMR